MQEVLTNAAKHGRPGLVQIKLTALGERGGVLEISDNGRGFRGGVSANGMSGFGPTQTRERAETRGGQFAVESVECKGTTVRAELPH